ncbi:unnamed protein product [Brassica rapa subsp. trilocularis]
MMAFIGDYRRNPIIGSSFLVSLSLSIKPEEEEEKRIGHGFAEQTPRDGHDEMVFTEEVCGRSKSNSLKLILTSIVLEQRGRQ